MSHWFSVCDDSLKIKYLPKNKYNFASKIKSGLHPWYLAIKESVGHPMVIMTMQSFKTVWYFFPLRKHGGGYWFIACRKWVMCLSLF